MPRKTRSKDDLEIGSNTIEEEGSLNEEQSEWLEKDLFYLSQSPLDVQLKAILGDAVAESFLHPTIKDKKKVRQDGKILLTKRQGALDAHVLWNDLRAHSKSKLSKEESEILNESLPYEKKKAAESKFLKRIQFSRHRTDLMHRISQTNKIKTKEMLKDFFLPSFDEDFSDLVKNGIKKILSPYQLHLEDDSLKLQGGSRVLNEAASKMRFLSEEDCRCDGKFQERMEGIGVPFNIGISLLDKGYKRSYSNISIHNKTPSNGAIKPQRSDLVLNFESEHFEDNFLFSRQQDWEPLTIDALIESGGQTDVGSIARS